jgi:hypothetical protein
LPEPATLQQLAGRDAYLDGLLDVDTGSMDSGPAQERIPE